MKSHSLSFLTVAAGLTLLAGCSDPSSDVHKSAASDPKAAEAAGAGGREFAITPGSTIGFVGSKVTGSHTGGFTNFSGSFVVKDGKISGSPSFKIDMKSTWSDNAKLTGHLHSPDFFDVAKFPESVFTATSIEAEGAGQKVTGNLQLHGVTKSISFPATIAVGTDSLSVKAEFAINRKDFAIVYPGRPDDLIRDNVVIKLDLKAAPKG